MELGKLFLTLFVVLLLCVSSASAACTAGKCTCTCSKCLTDSCTCSACTDSCPLTKCTGGSSTPTTATCSGASCSSGKCSTTASTCPKVTASTCALKAASGVCSTPKIVGTITGKKVSLKGSGTGATAYYWNFGDKTAPNNIRAQNPVHIYKKAGTYKVWLSVKCGNVWKDVGKTVIVK